MLLLLLLELVWEEISILMRDSAFNVSKLLQFTVQNVTFSKCPPGF